MKVLIFEFISGGGLNKEALPNTLLNEGLIMLNAVIEGFSKMKNVQLVVMQDFRVKPHLSSNNITRPIIYKHQNYFHEFVYLSTTCSFVWPIAPEFNSILLNLCKSVAPEKLLISIPSAIEITSNKFLTYKFLTRHEITTVPTQLLSLDCHYEDTHMLKSIDGAGCNENILITSKAEFDSALFHVNKYIIQPHIIGVTTSISCLFYNEEAQILSYNLQEFRLIKNHYQLAKITVNYSPYNHHHQILASKIAKAIPGLWGYIGIDLIETLDNIFVLEINPRLTTSFAGIYPSLGINIVEELFIMKNKNIINSTNNASFLINLNNN
jgi:predicted ATP-grasp superfamily ATP-dependent carboligase